MYGRYTYIYIRCVYIIIYDYMWLYMIIHDIWTYMANPKCMMEPLRLASSIPKAFDIHLLNGPRMS